MAKDLPCVILFLNIFSIAFALIHTATNFYLVAADSEVIGSAFCLRTFQLLSCTLWVLMSYFINVKHVMTETLSKIIL